MKKIISLFLLAATLLCGCAKPAPDDGINIVATVFPAFTLAESAAGENATVSMLLDPGTEIHNFEPTASDIKKIENADIFIYTGGESDTWIESVLAGLDRDIEIIKMTDHSSLIYEHGEHDEHSHKGHADEHVWLSPENAKSIITAIAEALAKIDSGNASAYMKNAESFCAEVDTLAAETAAVIASAQNKTLVVADRFPLKYFCDYFSLPAVAAFDACDHFSDASAKTVLRLIKTVENEGLSHVFYLENGSGYLADTVCEETGAEKLIFHSMHTVSREDFSRGVTYLDIMRQNIAALDWGLN